MLFRKIIIALLAAITVLLMACTAPKGGIVILENLRGTGFTMEFKEFSAKNKCELSMEKDDVLQIEVSRDGGEIALNIRGKNGSEPYTGNDLQSGLFTVTVSEADEYVVAITGDNAAGNVAVRNLGKKQEAMK
jgi:hypothetical protein